MKREDIAKELKESLRKIDSGEIKCIGTLGKYTATSGIAMKMDILEQEWKKQKEFIKKIDNLCQGSGFDEEFDIIELELKDINKALEVLGC